MAFISSEESLATVVSVLGETYGTAFHYCKQELWQISESWDRYETLFGSKERVEILNASGGHFWHAIQQMTHEHVLLGLCRMTDPPKSMGRRNLSVQYLHEADPTNEKQELGALARAAIEATDFARSWRNKRLAHNDLLHKTGGADQILPSTGLQISGAIVAIHDALRWVQARYFDGNLHLVDLGDSSANSVLFTLARGNKLAEMKKALIEGKNYEAAMVLDPDFPAQDYGRERRYAGQQESPLPRGYEGSLPLDS